MSHLHPCHVTDSQAPHGRIHGLQSNTPLCQKSSNGLRDDEMQDLMNFALLDTCTTTHLDHLVGEKVPSANFKAERHALFGPRGVNELVHEIEKLSVPDAMHPRQEQLAGINPRS